jgi:hypothetical protein
LAVVVIVELVIAGEVAKLIEYPLSWL